MRTVSGSGMRYGGFSGFAELKLQTIKSSVIARVDYFDWGKKHQDAGYAAQTRIIGGYAFHFLKDNTLLAEVDSLKNDIPGIEHDWQARLTMQVKFP